MILLHAALREDEFLLWGETAETARRRPPRHPRSATARQLAGIPGSHTRRKAVERAAWLPSGQDGPLPSSPLLGEVSSSGTKMAPWVVTALPLDNDGIIELLGGCVGRNTLAPGVVVGPDLAWWAAALRFAAGIATRQHFLPDVRKSDGIFRACWTPLYQADDLDRLSRIASLMPPAARALTDRGEKAPAAAPATLLRRFTARLVDHVARSGGAAPASFGDRAETKKAGARRRFDSIHDLWLHALQSSDGAMRAGTKELDRFARQVREWLRPVALPAASPFRLCFRLEEPAAESEAPARRTKRKRLDASAWTLRYLLQAADDPSLLIDAAHAWLPTEETGAVFRARRFEARPFLLSALGQASGLCPPVEHSLEASSPAACTLDTTGAHEFLSRHAPALEQSGFPVHLPAWWTRKGTKLRLEARARVQSPGMQSMAGITFDQVVRFDVELALGGEPLTLRELEALALLKSPLVRLRGQWVLLNAEEIRAAVEHWKKKAEKSATLGEIVRAALGAGSLFRGIPLEGVQADGWIGELLSNLEGHNAIEDLPPPGGFRGVLRPYQARGYSWLGFLRRWGLGACLADDMGLGKTVQSLALIQRDWETGGTKPVLLVCPTSVVSNWEKEAVRFCPDLPVMVHHGAGRLRKEAEFQERAATHAIVLTSYALLYRDVELLRSVRWSGLILDEAQNIKNPVTRQARAARSITAEYRVALTGTPVENHVGDLWSLGEFLNPGFLGSQEQFKKRFFIPIQAMRDAEAAARLQRLTAPFILRRLKTDRTIIADLPEKMEMKVFCSLTREQASLYKAVTSEAERAMREAEGMQRRGIILATLSKLKQVCNHPAQFLGDNSPVEGRSGKLARLVEMLEEVLEVGDRALVFSQFSEMGGILQRHLQETFGREVLFLHGGVPKRRRDAMVERFQGDSGPPVFILSLKAGGTGLNLTRASHVFHFDRWWNPAVENQATDRAFRIGQRKNVQVHKFLCSGTLEEKIDEMIERKGEIAGQIVGAGEGWITELSTDELKQLFALREEEIRG